MFNEVYSTNLREEDILEKLNRSGCSYYRATERYYPVHEQEFFYRVRSSDSSYYTSLKNIPDSALFIRQIAPDGFYVVPVYVLNGDTLKNLEISFALSSSKKKPTLVYVHSFMSDQSWKYKAFYSSKFRKSYRNHFKAFFEE